MSTCKKYIKENIGDASCIILLNVITLEKYQAQELLKAIQYSLFYLK